MKKILLIIFLIVSIIACDDESDIPNSIPFNYSTGLPLIKVKVNGVYAKLLVDTGASMSLIDFNAADEYDFEPYRLINMEVNGIGGTKQLYHTKGIETHYKNMPMYIRFKSSDLKNINLKLGIVGILGSDYLIQHKMVIDYKNKVLRKSTTLD